jgi:hypothetical protein
MGSKVGKSCASDERTREQHHESYEHHERLEQASITLP